MDWLNIFGTYLVLCACNAISISLNGKWKGFISSSGVSFIAEVPGGIYNDLESAGLIPKNLAGFNDIKNRWVANESVAYIRDIEVNNSLLNTPHLILTLHGVDTFATIYINDVKVGKTNNMFLKYNFNIKNNLKESKNKLKIEFTSSVKMAEQLYNIQSSKYIVPPKCVPKEYNGQCHVNHIRKMQASYGWDWGPAFPSMGIWKDVELTPVTNILVSEVTTDITRKSNLWQVKVTIFFETFGEKNFDMNKTTDIFCSLEKEINISKSVHLEVRNKQANTSLILDVPADKVELWWPNGYGNQKLYLLHVKVKTESDVTEKTFKIGFRSVELIQNPLKKGLSFYFKINGIPIFAKGSNWIPSSVFPENLAKKATLQHLLQSAKRTHMNMLRVWGGGVYESDLFYSLADEYGIMIWQDFMFACSMYPTTNSFLNNVREEVRQNMVRLKNHASVVLWAGNNENEAALYGDWYGTGTSKIYKIDYIKLYVNTIEEEAKKIDSTRPFVVSSPSNGLYSEKTNYTESNPYSNYYGDVHYYNYLKNGWDINQYPVTRFASEYGFQALPSIWTFISVAENLTDLQWDSPFMKHRQHLPQGNNYMKLLINKNFAAPKSGNKIKELMHYIYLSQVTQAVSLKIQTESYRQMKSLFNDLDEGMTMGALYWQLNDVWQAPSWSSIDFEGKWKMLHYFAKDFFSPLIVTSRLNQANELSIYVVSDLLHKLNNLTIEMNVYEWNSSKCIYINKTNNINVEPNESRLVTQDWIDVFLQKAGCGLLSKVKENCMIELVLKDDNNKKIAPANYVYPIPLKNVALPNDSIEVKIQPNTVLSSTSNENDFYLEITSQSLSLFVWLEIGNIRGHFSENGFHILKGKKKVIFHAFEDISTKDISKNLIVTSLSKIYNVNNVYTDDAQIVIDSFTKF